MKNPMVMALMVALIAMAPGIPALAGEPAPATATVQYKEIPRSYVLDGVVEAVYRSTVSAQVQGKVAAVLADVDDSVEKDAVLVRFDDTEQQASVDQAEADLRKAEASLHKARQDHDRARDLYAKKLVSKSDLDKAEAELKTARAQRDVARAGLDQARQQLAYTRVRAPFAGIVTERYVEVGEIAQPGQKLMSGLSLEHLRVDVDVPQMLVPLVRKLGKAKVLVPEHGWVEPAALTVFPQADRDTNTIRVRLRLPQGSEGLFPGMLVKTAFILGSRRVLTVPRQAVAYRSEVTGVYVRGPDGKVRLRHVRLGRKLDDGSVEVLAGLDPDEQVLLDPVAGASLARQAREGGKHE